MSEGFANEEMITKRVKAHFWERGAPMVVWEIGEGRRDDCTLAGWINFDGADPCLAESISTCLEGEGEGVGGAS